MKRLISSLSIIISTLLIISGCDTGTSTFTVKPTSVEIAAAGGSDSYTQITTTGDWTAEITSGDWLTLGKTSGSGDYKMYLTGTENVSGAARYATFEVHSTNLGYSIKVTVVQNSVTE